MRLDADGDVEVSGRAALVARLALAAQPDLRAVVRCRRGWRPPACAIVGGRRRRGSRGRAGRWFGPRRGTRSRGLPARIGQRRCRARGGVRPCRRSWRRGLARCRARRGIRGMRRRSRSGAPRSLSQYRKRVFQVDLDAVFQVAAASGRVGAGARRAAHAAEERVEDVPEPVDVLKAVKPARPPLDETPAWPYRSYTARFCASDRT